MRRLAFGVSAFGVEVDEVDLVDGVDGVEVKGGTLGCWAWWNDTDEGGCLA